MLLPTLCRIVICASVTKNRRLIATTQKNHPWTTQSLVIIGLFQKSSKKVLPYVFRTTWNPTNLMNRHNQPTSDFIAVKSLFYAYTMIFCAPMTIVTVLYSCYLTAAFDTVNHDILLTRLKFKFSICGTALEWFRSYLTNRTQFTLIDGKKITVS